MGWILANPNVARLPVRALRSTRGPACAREPEALEESPDRSTLGLAPSACCLVASQSGLDGQAGLGVEPLAVDLRARSRQRGVELARRAVAAACAQPAVVEARAHARDLGRCRRVVAEFRLDLPNPSLDRRIVRRHPDARA